MEGFAPYLQCEVPIKRAFDDESGTTNNNNDIVEMLLLIMDLFCDKGKEEKKCMANNNIDDL